MKKYYCIVYLLMSALFLCSGVLYAQETSLSRQQRIQLANEHYAKGKEYNQQGDYAKANEEFKKAQDLLAELEGGAQSQVLASSAPVYIGEQPAKEALSIPATTTVKKGKDGRVKAPAILEDVQREADNYFRHGLEFARKGQLPQAIDAYKKGLELTPENPSLHYNLAIEYLKSTKFAEAAEEFKKVVEANPKDKDAYYNLGVLNDSYLGDKDAAKMYYEKYLKISGNPEEKNQVKAWVAQIDKDKKELR